MSNDKIKHLEVVTPQGLSGNLVKESTFVFNYTAHERAQEVSLIMPMRAASYTDGALMPVFAMNKPEGYLLDKLKEKFGKYVDLDDMRLLAITGGNQIGRLRYQEPGKAREKVRAEVGLDTLLSSGASEELFDYLVNQYLTSGISGFQPKVMIPDADLPAVAGNEQGWNPAPGGGPGRSPIVEKTTSVTPDLIVKAAGDDYEFLSQNEFLCMSAARKAGIRVPDFWLSEDGSLFVMRRFDLEGPEQRPLGFEDMAVLLRKSADDKYKSSYETVGKLLAVLCEDNRTESLARYFEYVALSMMVRNGDAHLKNFGVIYDQPGGRTPELAPLYDVVTTSTYGHQDPQSGRVLSDRTPALKMAKQNVYPDRKTLLSFGRTICGVAKPEEVVDRIASAMEDVLTEESQRIDSGFLRKLKAEWDAGMFSVAATKSFAPKGPIAAEPESGL